jgi:hypothetical protein
VEHVRAVQNVYLCVPEAVVAYGAVPLVPARRLVSDRLPEGVELLFFSGMPLSVLSRTLPPLLPDAGHVRQKAVQQLVCVFNAPVHFLDGTQDLLPLLGHHCQVPFPYAT